MSDYKKVMGFDKGPLPMMCEHEFIAEDGKLIHKIDGQLRAIVPQDGFEDYAAAWPECIDVLPVISA